MTNKFFEKILSFRNIKINNHYYKLCTIAGIKIKKRNGIKELEEINTENINEIKKLSDNLKNNKELIKKQDKSINKTEKQLVEIQKQLNKTKQELDKQKKLTNKTQQQLEETKKKLKTVENYFKLKKNNSINKEKILFQIEKLKNSGITEEKRDTQLVVSLTSFPDRIYEIHYTIFSLLNQTLKPDKVVLWLAEEQFPNKEDDLSQILLKMKQFGLTIKWCEDIKSYKKLIPTLKEHPNDIIITADDDAYYASDWLEKLYDEYQKSDKRTIVANRCHRIKIRNNSISPYKDWYKVTSNKDASFLNFLTGVGGVLYPPCIFTDEFLEADKFIQTCPSNDDIWFWGMAVLNDIKIKVVEREQPYEICHTNIDRELGNIKDEETLYMTNSVQNDVQIKNITEKYPEILEKVLKSYIAVSVVIPVYNKEQYLHDCLNSLCNQTLKNIEIICINDASTDNSPNILEEFAQKDSRIKIINNAENFGISKSRNIGMEIAHGEYIGFVDGDDWIDLNYYEELYNKAIETNADFVRTVHKCIFTEREEEHKLNDIINNAIENNRDLKINEHSSAVWDAIYNANFLNKNNIKFHTELTNREDVPYTTEITFKAKKRVPVNTTFYHYRQNIKCQLSTPCQKLRQDMIKANQYVADFLNSYENVPINDYITAYQKILVKLNDKFKIFKRENIFDDKTQKEYFDEYVNIFNKNKYPEDLQYDSFPYFTYIKNNDYEGYLNYLGFQLSSV